MKEVKPRDKADAVPSNELSAPKAPEKPPVTLRIREDASGRPCVAGYFPGPEHRKPGESERVKPGETFTVPYEEAKKHLKTKLVEVVLPDDDEEVEIA